MCTRWSRLPGQAAKVMPEGGSLLTLTYFGGERVVPGYNLMGVAKAALDASVKYLAYDLGPRKIRVNAVSAGPGENPGRLCRGRSRQSGRAVLLGSALGPQHHPRGSRRRGHVSAFNLASGITGEILHVDCGYNVMGSPGRAIEAVKAGTL